MSEMAVKRRLWRFNTEDRDEQKDIAFARINRVANELGFVNPYKLLSHLNKYVDDKAIEAYTIRNLERKLGSFPTQFVNYLVKSCDAVNYNYIVKGIGEPLIEGVPITWRRFTQQGESQLHHSTANEAETPYRSAGDIAWLIAGNNTMNDFIYKGDKLGFVTVEPDDIREYGQIHRVLTADNNMLIRYLFSMPDHPKQLQLRAHNRELAPDVIIAKSDIVELQVLVEIRRDMRVLY